MRTVLSATLALAFCGPLAAHAAGNGASSEIRDLVGAYQHVTSVRVVERFENGALATVDVIPSGQYRVASTGGQDPALILRVATQPVDGAEYNPSYKILRTGTKTIDGAKTSGFRVMAPDGTYDATVWINEYHLPVFAHVVTQGHSIDVTYGDYNDSALVAHP